jgi:microcystin-dependent protein
MSKSAFVSGTTVLSKWLNSIFGGGAAAPWAANTAYAVGFLIAVTGGKVFRAIVAGTTGSSQPTWPSTIRDTVTDGGVTWELFKGHLHDNGEMDGSCPKVDLTSANEVTGVLPAANVDLSTVPPIGVVLPFMGTTTPTGFLVCDGSTFNATTYAALNTLLGGNTLPNLKGKFLVGYDAAVTDYNEIGKTGGQKNLSPHFHSLIGFPTGDAANIGIGTPTGGDFVTPDYIVPVSGGAHSKDVVITDTIGSGTINDENRPPFYSINYIIRAI